VTDLQAAARVEHAAMSVPFGAVERSESGAQYI